jgi:hypothetical protein
MAKTNILDAVEIVPLDTGPYLYAFRAKRTLTTEEVMEACEMLAILNGTEGGTFYAVKDRAETDS